LRYGGVLRHSESRFVEALCVDGRKLDYASILR
jgi:hypothetical protein